MMPKESKALDTLAVKLVDWARSSLTDEEKEELVGLLLDTELCPIERADECDNMYSVGSHDCWLQAIAQNEARS